MLNSARMRPSRTASASSAPSSPGPVAIASADRVYMLENSIYSVITPEGCASILWRDGAKAQDAADALHAARAAEVTSLWRLVAA